MIGEGNADIDHSEKEKTVKTNKEKNKVKVSMYDREKDVSRRTFLKYSGMMGFSILLASGNIRMSISSTY